MSPVMQAMTEEKHEAKERPEDIERIMMGHCLGFGTTDVQGDLIKYFPPKYSHHDPTSTACLPKSCSTFLSSLPPTDISRLH